MGASVVAAGGGGGSDTVDGSEGGGSEPTVVRSRVDYFRDATSVPKLLRDQFGEVPQLRRLTLTQDTIRAEIRDPQIPENLDTWEYRDGKWTSTPVSVSVREIEQFDEVTIVPGSIAWDRVPELIQATYDGVDLEKESVTAVSYDRLAGEAPRVFIGVSGLRGSGRLTGLADGTEYEVERS